jgi:two-component system phosphate regulon sensor histidine kinase PhoR
MLVKEPKQSWLRRLSYLGWLLIIATIASIVLTYLAYHEVHGQASQKAAELLIVGFGGTLTLLLLVCFGVHSQHRRERQLEQTKDEFVSLVSHQLRAPLTAIRLFIEMLLDEQVGHLTQKQHEYLGNIEVSTSRMIDLVSDFLNTSRMGLEHLKIEPQQLHLEDLIDTIVTQLTPLARQQKITMTFEKPSFPTVAVEPSLYSQIVNNLLTNALSYTPAGGTVTVSLIRTNDGYRLDVADTGIGIPESARADLFRRFYRADNAKRVVSEGSGLGLYLIKQIVEICQGKVWYESVEHKGTTFHVIIPLSGMAAKSGTTSLK